RSGRDADPHAPAPVETPPQTVPPPAYRHPGRAGELTAGGGTAVAWVTAAPAGHGVDVPGGHLLAVEGPRRPRHDPDQATGGVRGHQIARVVFRHPAGPQFGRRGGAEIA